MSESSRREFLRVSGTLLGGIAVGTQVAAATRTDRFIAETSGNKTPSDIDVVHEMPGVKYVVVEGEEDAVEESKAVKDYAADVELELSDPDANDHAPAFDQEQYEGQPGDFLQWDKADLNVPDAHEITEGEGSRVTIIDSGVLETHPDLEEPLNVELSRNFTDDGGDHNPVGSDHGTHVAGIVAADNSGGLGVNGTAPKTDLVDCRVFSAEGGALFGDILAAIVYSAAIDADVANFSLGAYPVPRQGLGSFYGGVLNAVMTFANKEGTLLVSSAGNEAADLQHDKNFISLPTENAQVLAVSATGPVGHGWDATAFSGEEPPESPAIYTNFGTNAITIGAPGGDIDGEILEILEKNNDDDPDNDEPVPNVPYFQDFVFNTTFEVVEDEEGELVQVPSYGWKAGTSMAAPNVAGAAALVKSADQDLNASQVESILKRTAGVPDDYEREFYGGGYLDPVSAVEEADGSDDSDSGNENNGNGEKNGT